MSTPTHQYSLRDRLFCLISFHDVELAETFLVRCPDTDSVVTLNDFFRRTFSLMSINTDYYVSQLFDHSDHNTWLQHFQSVILPLLLQERFPNDNQQNCVSFYATP